MKIHWLKSNKVKNKLSKEKEMQIKKSKLFDEIIKSTVFWKLFILNFFKEM